MASTRPTLRLLLLVPLLLALAPLARAQYTVTLNYSITTSELDFVPEGSTGTITLSLAATPNFVTSGVVASWNFQSMSLQSGADDNWSLYQVISAKYLTDQWRIRFGGPHNEVPNLDVSGDVRWTGLPTDFVNYGLPTTPTDTFTYSSIVWSLADTSGEEYLYFSATGVITSISVSGNIVIPEPSTTAALFGALGLGFVAWRRRRLQSARG